MQRIERAALKELLEDYKNVVAQRNELQDVKETFTQKVGQQFY